MVYKCAFCLEEHPDNFMCNKGIKGPRNSYTLEDSGGRTEFDTGAVRDLRVGKGRFDLVPPEPYWALAIHYEIGCQKYGDRNWEMGIPLSKYIDSAERHLQELKMGLGTENHPVAVIWNMFCFYATMYRIQRGKLPESLDDLVKSFQLPLLPPDRGADE